MVVYRTPTIHRLKPLIVCFEDLRLEALRQRRGMIMSLLNVQISILRRKNAFDITYFMVVNEGYPVCFQFEVALSYQEAMGEATSIGMRQQ